MSAFEELAKLALKEYEEGHVRITPMYPSILVRVIPKPERFGSIYLTEKYRNKPFYEGIVLQTYKPKKFNYKGKELVTTCELQPGDHILFPYWAGEGNPVPGMDENEYRMVPDFGALNSGGNDTGHPRAVLTYEDRSVRESLIELLSNSLNATWAADKILERFHVIRKDHVAKTDYVQPTRPD